MFRNIRASARHARNPPFVAAVVPRVFALGEMLEAVLTHIHDPRALLRLQRVNKAFREEILRNPSTRQALFHRRRAAGYTLYTTDPMFRSIARTSMPQ
jgi:uncharacterized protein (DUF2461 family)